MRGDIHMLIKYTFSSLHLLPRNIEFEGSTFQEAKVTQKLEPKLLIMLEVADEC